jgi:hypothetical protein
MKFVSRRKEREGRRKRGGGTMNHKRIVLSNIKTKNLIGQLNEVCKREMEGEERGEGRRRERGEGRREKGNEEGEGRESEGRIREGDA